MPKLPISVLDLAPVPSGSTPAAALHNSLDLARHVDKLGYHRYWLAEHHNSMGIASSSPEIMIGHVASATQNLRVGSGGVMLPNHSPLKVAELFRTLEALHPGRIDLGLGRAPGTDPQTASALRRTSELITGENFPNQLLELLEYFEERPLDSKRRHGIVAMPTGVDTPEIWILGSSGVGTDMAAEFGVGAAFANHFAPKGAAAEVLTSYRARFTPSRYRQTPYSIVATSVICADTEAEAEELATSIDLSGVRRFQGGSGQIPSPLEARFYAYAPEEERQRQANRLRYTIGDPATVRAELLELVTATQADELMVLTMVHDHDARRRSYELVAEIMDTP